MMQPGSRYRFRMRYGATDVSSLLKIAARAVRTSKGFQRGEKCWPPAFAAIIVDCSL